MEPIRLTRQEYKELYGEDAPQPIQNLSELDNAVPTPVTMTRAEYNARYFPQAEQSKAQAVLSEQGDENPFDIERALKSTSGFFRQAGEAAADFGSDIKENIGDFQQRRDRSEQRVFDQEQTPLSGTFDTVGSMGLFAGETVFEGLLSVGKVLLNEKGEEQTAKFFSDWGSAIADRYGKSMEELRVSDDQSEKRVAQLNDDHAFYYANDPEYRDRVDASGGFAEVLFGWVGGGKAKNILEEGVDAASDFSRRADDLNTRYQTPIPSRAQEMMLDRVEKDIFDIENKYVRTRSANDRLNDGGSESRRRIAQTVDLNQAVDEDGIVRTTVKGGVADQYFDQTLKGVEDVVRRNLVNEGASINIEELRRMMTTRVYESGLEGADLLSAVNKIEKELRGATLRGNALGNIPLQNIQDLKINSTKNINYEKPTVQTYQKTIASVYKDAIERKSNLNIKQVNSELAKFYGDLERIKRLDGKRVKGGRLGRYSAGLAGNVVGAGAGMFGGAAGAVIGGVMGGEIASFMQGRAMANTFPRNRRAGAPSNDILDAAKKQADEGTAVDLKTPDKPMGVPKDIPHNVETRKLERAIKKNVADQKKAIAIKDYTLVATLKQIFQDLVARLNDEVQLIKDNMKSQGGFIGKGGPRDQRRIESNNRQMKNDATTANKNTAIDSSKADAPSPSNKVINIHPEDQVIMENFITSARLKEVLPANQEVMVDKLMERWDINPDMDANKIANIFEDILSGKRKVKSTTRLGREFDTV